MDDHDDEGNGAFSLLSWFLSDPTGGVGIGKGGEVGALLN